MLRSRSVAAWLLCAALSGAACDRMPLDAALGDDALDLLGGGGQAVPLPLSTPGLLGTALMKLYADEGAAAVWTRVAELRELHDAAQAAAANGEAAAAERLADRARAEELRFVLETLGEGTVEQVVAHAGDALARLRLQIADGRAAGADLDPVLQIMADAEAALARAAAARRRGTSDAALLAATHAVDLLEDARQAAADLAGTPSIEHALERALLQVAAVEGDAAAAALAAPYRRLVAEARAAVIGSRSGEAQAALAAARAEAIRVVLQTFGPHAAVSQVAAVSSRLERARAGIAAAGRAGGDTFELERMARAALDLETRATQALRENDPARALDLGSHAAGLIDELLLRLAALQ